MKVSAITCPPSAPRRFGLVFGTNAIEPTILIKLAEATHSLVMSQDALSPVIRRCGHNPRFGELANLKAFPLTDMQGRHRTSSGMFHRSWQGSVANYSCQISQRTKSLSIGRSPRISMECSKRPHLAFTCSFRS